MRGTLRTNDDRCVADSKYHRQATWQKSSIPARRVSEVLHPVAKLSSLLVHESWLTIHVLPAVSGNAVHQDGTAHIKDQVFNGRQADTTGTTGVSSNPEPIAPAKPPASNPGADDPTAGIGKDAGGVSSTAHIESPVQESGQDGEKGIVGTVLGYLGLNSTSVEPEREAADVDARNAGTAGPAAATDGAIATGMAGAAAGGVLASRGETVDIPDRTRSSTANGSSGGVPKSTMDRFRGDNSTATGSDSTSVNTGATAGRSAAAHTDPNASSTTANITNMTGNNDVPPQRSSSDGAVGENPDSIVRDLPPPQQQHENTQNIARDDTDNKNLPDKDASGENEHKPPQHEETKSSQKGSSMENRESIPTAGGQKLGDKHWGESSIVPDVPPKSASEAGIASKEGQPNGKS